MALRIIPYGIDIGAVSLQGGDSLPINKAGNDTVVDLAAGGPRGGYPVAVINFSVSGNKDSQGNIEVPLAPLPAERRRGWAELNSSFAGVLAYLIIGERDFTVITFPRPSTTDWMSHLPDEFEVADLTVPGSHESASLHGLISRCQDHDVNQQLQDGIRVFDIRLKVVEGVLQVYHGIQSQKSDFRTQVNWINEFLRQHPREAVFVFVKQEGPPDDPAFAKLVNQQLDESGLWRFDQHFPKLGEVRGKATLVSRFRETNQGDCPKGLGIHPSTWPDSKEDGFEWECHGKKVRVHDWYGIDSILQNWQKAQAVTSHLEETLGPRQGSPMTIDFTSASKFPAAQPNWVAKGFGLTNWGLGSQGVNSFVTKWLLEKAVEGKRPRATLMMDFYRYAGSGDTGLATLMVALNFIINN